MWRHTLALLLTSVYHEIYGSADAMAIAASSSRKRKNFDAANAVEGECELQFMKGSDATTENFVAISFTPEVLGGTDTLLELYQVRITPHPPFIEVHSFPRV